VVLGKSRRWAFSAVQPIQGLQIRSVETSQQALLWPMEISVDDQNVFFLAPSWPQGRQTQGPSCGHLESAVTSALGTPALERNYLDCLIAKQAWNAVSAAALEIIPVSR